MFFSCFVFFFEKYLTINYFCDPRREKMAHSVEELGDCCACQIKDIQGQPHQVIHKASWLLENSKVKSPFRRFWIRSVISSHMCEFMDDMFDKLKKAYFRSCLTFWWSKVDSDVLFRSQKLILTFSEIWQSGTLKRCETSTVSL